MIRIQKHELEFHNAVGHEEDDLRAQGYKVTVEFQRRGLAQLDADFRWEGRPLVTLEFDPRAAYTECVIAKFPSGMTKAVLYFKLWFVHVFEPALMDAIDREILRHAFLRRGVALATTEIILQAFSRMRPDLVMQRRAKVVYRQPLTRAQVERRLVDAGIFVNLSAHVEQDDGGIFMECSGRSEAFVHIRRTTDLGIQFQD